MNHVVVVDASVAFKVIIQEEFSVHARTLFTTNLRDGNSIIAPPHLASEVINGIYQKLRRNNIVAQEAEQAVGDFLDLPIQAISPSELYQRAFVFARSNSLASIYTASTSL